MSIRASSNWACGGAAACAMPDNTMPASSRLSLFMVDPCSVGIVRESADLGNFPQRALELLRRLSTRDQPSVVDHDGGHGLDATRMPQLLRLANIICVATG